MGGLGVRSLGIMQSLLRASRHHIGVKSHVKWENCILSEIFSKFLRYTFQFLKLQFPTKILALSIIKNREALRCGVLRGTF